MRGQISLEFLVMGILGVLFAWNLISFSVFFNESQSDASIANQLQHIGQHIRQTAELEAEYQQTDCLLVETPLVFDANQNAHNPCDIVFEKKTLATHPDQFQLFYPGKNDPRIQIDINLVTKNISGPIDTHCGQSVRLKGTCP